MPDYELSLFRYTTQSGGKLASLPTLGAIWSDDLEAMINDQPYQQGTGVFVDAASSLKSTCFHQQNWLSFELSSKGRRTTTKREGDVIQTAKIGIDSNSVLLRFDEVSFPPGACAYRHIHPGPGIRFLTGGILHLKGDEHTILAHAGDAWFEDANSPVRATAGSEAGITSFIRFMVLPVQCFGNPTIQILDPTDAQKPRLQTTKRHFDRVVQLDPG